MMLSTNVPALLAAGAAAFILGFLWHGPLFGKQWIALMGIPQSEVDAMKAKGMGAMAPQMLCAFLQQVVVAFVLGSLLANLSVADMAGAAMLAALVWLGFIATTLLNGVLWEKRTMNLYLFNIVYHLVSLILIAMVLTLMG
jgi:hypothetical protein